MRSLAERLAALVEKWGALLAALTAAGAALPGLRFPFLAEDWMLVDGVGHAGPPPAIAFGYFRPIYGVTFWVDRRLWGPSPPLFHLTNLLLIAISAALVVVLLRAYTQDARLAGAAGLLFALHPYHVENAAWIAVRGDPLFSVFAIAAALAYDRWRVAARGVPILSLALLEAALLSKETAIVLPPIVILIGLMDPRRRPGGAELMRGYLPLVLVTVAHLLLLRPLVLGPAPRGLVQGVAVVDGLKRLSAYAVGAILGADIENVATQPVLWGGLAAALVACLLVLARRGSGEIPRAALGAAAVFFVLAAPAVIGLQERFLFLAVAASALVLAALIRAARGWLAGAAGAMLVSGWLAGLIVQWGNWNEAAVASRSLVQGLASASLREGIEEIVVANMPFRVRGGAVFAYGEFVAALALSGGRPLPVRAATYISYPRADADALEGPLSTSISGAAQGAEVRLRIAEGPFFHYAGPGALRRAGVLRTGSGTITFDGTGGARVEIVETPRGTRAAYVWARGRLDPLF